MPPADDPTPIQACLNRIASGDPAARGALVQVSRNRLLGLTRTLLRRYPSLRRWTQSDDVLQAALVRLCRTLDAVPAGRTADFLALAALNIRRELLDLTRHYFGPEGIGTRHETPADDRAEPVAVGRDPGPDELATWREVQAQLERLPDDERAVVYLRFYLGMSHPEVAAALGTSERTVKRRYLAARLRLRRVYRVELAANEPTAEDFLGPDVPPDSLSG